jgi:tRNA A-37 threonylcarbamoyl transferase component Bud32
MSTSPVSTQRLGRYRVLGHLAAGGMAEILLASLDGPAGFQKLVVLKRVLPHLASKSEFRRMFLDEARIVASLRHPNIVQVTELSKDGDELFLAMEYLEGESVQRLFERVGHAGRRLDYALGAHIVAAACAGLHAAHEHTGSDGAPKHIVHRDVSPHNLFVTYDGMVKVIDFGVATAADRYAHTSTGQIKGKFGYMSPEQCLAEPVDRRTDVFALGIVLWEATTGERLFRRDNEMQVLRAICDEPVPLPSTKREGYPPALERIVMRALSQRREDRYDTAADMRSELLAVIAEIGTPRVLEDALALEMAETFRDRIARKKGLARQIGAGEIAGPLDWLDASTDDALADAGPAWSGLRSSMEATAPQRRAPRRRVWLALGGLALVSLVGVGAVFGIRALGEGATDAPIADAPIADAPLHDAPVDDAPVADVPAPDAPLEAPAPEPTLAAESDPLVVAPSERAARIVVVDLDSSPSGATVIIDGEERGTTPLALSVPEGSDVVEVRLEHLGYRPLTEAIVPDVNQRMRLVLVRDRRPTKRAHGGFERFD